MESKTNAAASAGKKTKVRGVWYAFPDGSELGLLEQDGDLNYCAPPSSLAIQCVGRLCHGGATEDDERIDRALVDALKAAPIVEV